MAPDHVQLLSDSLLIRAPREGDAPALFEAARESVGEVGRWLPWCHAGYQPEDSAAWVITGRSAWLGDESYPMFIFDRQTGQLVGGTGINEIDRLRRRANLGYWVRSSRMRHGIATTSTQMVARWGFDVLGLQRIEIVAASGNTASQRVATKVGALREGLCRNRLRVHDVPTDAWIYSLVPSDVDLW